MRPILFFLPEGESRIVRQFTAGFRFDISQVPKGRLNPSKAILRLSFPFLWECFSRPFGTRCSHSTNPPLKGWAILKTPFGSWPTKCVQSVSVRTTMMKLCARPTRIWSAVTCHRFCRFGDLSPKQGRVQRPGKVGRLSTFDGDKSLAESADKSAHSKP